MNIRFEYLYRDAANYKNWGDIVFANQTGINVTHLEQMARKILIDQEYFVAHHVEIPDLKFSETIDELDHGWHEYSSFSQTLDEPSDTKGRDILDFINALEVASQQ